MLRLPTFAAFAGLVAVAATAASAGQGGIPPPTINPPRPPVVTGSPPLPPVGPTPPATYGQALRAGTITGIVVDGTSGRGIAKAVLRLSGAAHMTRVSDDRGRFTFTGVPLGDVTIAATKTGYFDGEYGKSRATGVGVPLTVAGLAGSEIRINLFRAATISGFIVDEANEPVIGMRVVAMRRQFVGGQWRYVPGESDTTDDRGAYRVFGLMPGEYIVGVPSVQVTIPVSTIEEIGSTGTVSSGMAAMLQAAPGAMAGPAEGVITAIEQLRDGDHILLSGRMMPPLRDEGARRYAYPTLYYPAADVAILALPVTLDAGEVRFGLDFQLRPVPTARVSGAVVGPDGVVAGQVLRLFPAGADDGGPGTETATTVSASDGTFTFLRVPEGRYVLEARNPLSVLAPAAPSDQPPPVTLLPTETLWARREVAVDIDDVQDVIVTMQPGVTVLGRLEFDGPGERPGPGQLAGIPISLEPAPGTSGSPQPLRVGASGGFGARGLAPGEYVVRLGRMPPGWYLKSMRGGDRDLTEEPLDATSEQASVVITFTSRATRIIGTVRDAGMQPTPGATILVMPAGRGAAATTLNPNRTREIRSNSHGVFTLEGLPPGDYLIVGIDDAAAEGWQDARTLASLRSLATRISLTDGESKTLDLRMPAFKR